MKNALLVSVISAILAASSGCCGLGHGYCCQDTGPYGGCYENGCYDSCGGCGGCGTSIGHGGIIDWLFSCGQHGDCGPTYWGELSDKPDLCDPCDRCGNWTGQTCYGECGGGDCCGGCGSNYYPYSGGSGGGYFEGGYSDMQFHDGPAVKGSPTPAKPPVAEPIPVPGNRSSSYHSRSGYRRVSYDQPQHAPRAKSRSELRR
ncbi:MAG: hypothetical protein KF708_15390 [Pirellulales bacterium]|nr:hypothetical protein [Pirellulales bacterium]